MKTLYINISSERIETSDTIDVLEYDLINDFYFTLGEKLLVRFPVAGVDKIKLFTEYMDTCDASGADSILEQWSQLKAQLFGESLQGTFTIHLPDSYLSWLKYNENTDYCRLAETLPSCIDIDLEEFYEDSIDSLRRRIFRYLQKDDRYNEIDEIVFNDYAVVRKSEIVRQIKVKYADIKFVTYEKWIDLCNNDKETKSESKDSCKSTSPELISYRFVVSNGDDKRETIEIYDANGSKTKGIVYLLPVQCAIYHHHTFIIGLNTKDDMLYFVSNKQVLPLCDWSDGELYCEKYNEQLLKYRNRKYGVGLKDLFIAADNASFYIRDRYDYETYYKVKGGFCHLSDKGEIRMLERGMPYYMDDEEDTLKCLSTRTGEEFTIPGFKLIIYLGNNGVDLFWATRKYNPGQHRFKESYIVDSKGNIIREYEYNVAYPLSGKYVINTKEDRIFDITDFNGNQIIQLNLKEYDPTEIKEVAPGIYKFDTYTYNGPDIYWLSQENVICDAYDKRFYYKAIGRYYSKMNIYRRNDNGFVGKGEILSEFVGIYYCQNMSDERGYSHSVFLNEQGEEVYRLKDNEVFEFISENGKENCGIGENRIIISVDDRYYKIIDYSGNEIARIDLSSIADRYYDGRLFYYNGGELGYYDLDGKKCQFPFQRGYIDGITVLNGRRVVVKVRSDEDFFYVLNFDGQVLFEGVNHGTAKFDHRYIAYHKELTNYTTSYVVDLDGNELFKAETQPHLVSVLDGGILNE